MRTAYFPFYSGSKIVILQRSELKLKRKANNGLEEIESPFN